MKNLKSSHWILFVLIATGIALLLYCFRSCGTVAADRNNGLLLFPEEVAVVVSIDLPQIFKEVNWADLSQSDSYRDYVEKAKLENPVFAGVLNDPIGAGVKLDQHLYYGFLPDHDDFSDQFSVIAIALENAADFEKMVKKVVRGTIREYPTFKSVHLDKLTPIGWNQDYALFGAASLFVDLDEKLSNFFNTPPEKSLASNTEAMASLKSGKEFSIWACSDFMSNSVEWQNAFGLGGLDSSLVKGNYLHGYFNFDKGSLEGLADLKLKPEVSQSLTKYFSGKVSSSNLKYVPEENLGFFMSSAINLPGLYNNIMSSQDMKRFVEALLKKNQLSMNDFFKTFGGEVILVSYKEKESDLPVAMLLMDIVNEAGAKKIARLISTLGFIRPEGENQYFIPGTVGDSGGIRVTFPDQKMRLYHNDQILCISSDVKLLNGVQKGGLPANMHLKSDKIRAGMLTALVDATVFPNLVARTGQEQVERIEFSFDDKKLWFHLTFADKESNLLQQLFNFN